MLLALALLTRRAQGAVAAARVAAAAVAATDEPIGRHEERHDDGDHGRDRGPGVLTREGRRLLEGVLGVAVVAEDRPGGTDAVQLGDAASGLPDTQERFLDVHPLEAPLGSVRISVLAAGPGRARPPRR